MHENTANSPGKPWTKRALSAIAAVVVTAVPALGFTTLAPAIFSPQLAEAGTGSETEAGVSNGLLTFDAPTMTLQRTKETERSVQENAVSQEDVQVLTDWRYTQSFRQDLQAILAADRDLADALSFGNPILSQYIYIKILQAQLVSAEQGIHTFTENYKQLSPIEKLFVLEILYNFFKHHRHHSPHR
jgi:hypothetical protein